MNQPRFAVLGLLAGLAAVAAFNPTANAQAAAASSHVGVVNLRLVYTSIQETIDSQHQLQGMQEQLDQKQKLDQLTLKDLQDKMSQVAKPGTDAHQKAMEDFDAKSLEFQLNEQSMKVKMVRSQGKQLVTAFHEIQAAVADLAKKKGLDLVLVNSGTDVPDNAQDIANPETLGNLIFQRNVMYASDKVDISSDVIAALNAAYKAGPAK